MIVRGKSSFFSIISQYLIAILVIGAVTVILRIFRSGLSIQVIALLYLLPVILSASLWGLSTGILVSVVSFLTFNYFFIPPYGTFSVHSTQDLLALIVFLIVAVVISQSLGQARAGVAMAVSRERDATQLYELSLSLAGVHDEQSIMHTLVEQIKNNFPVEAVQIRLTRQGITPSTYGLPEGNDLISSRPGLTFPISTARGSQGDILLWFGDKALTSQAERLVKIYASQGALALERAALSQAENRTRVLEESDRLKTALLSSVSHELRTPLATIKASVSSLRSGAVDLESDASRDLLSAIEEETDHLNQLVGNILDMSRIETGALVPQKKWNALDEIVNGVVHRMQPALQNHVLEVDIPQSLPLVATDYMQMEQVFTNLISNSVKYAPAKTVIHIGAQIQSDHTLLVQVSNQGPRVRSEDLERIFDKFYRVTAADKVTGTGLGLSICKGIIEAHGGRIWAENSEDCFTFNFTLPLTWEGKLPNGEDEKGEA